MYIQIMSVQQKKGTLSSFMRCSVNGFIDMFISTGNLWLVIPRRLGWGFRDDCCIPLCHHCWISTEVVHKSLCLKIGKTQKDVYIYINIYTVYSLNQGPDYKTSNSWAPHGSPIFQTNPQSWTTWCHRLGNMISLLVKLTNIWCPLFHDIDPNLTFL